MTALRILDTGIRTARENLALTAALAEGHRASATPDTLRFQDFYPAAIVGRHQSLAREVHLDRCRDLGVQTARRMTGGGAIYMAPGLLGWELIASRNRLPQSLDAITHTLCTGLASGLGTLGVDARFRPRNDIEVGGKKLSGTGGYIDGGTLVFQGTVLIDFDPATMADVLTLPALKRDRHAVAALADRVTSLRHLLGTPPPRDAVIAAVTHGLTRALGLPPSPGMLTAQEQAAASHLHTTEFGTDAFVNGHDVASTGGILTIGRSIPAGLLEAHITIRNEAAPVIDRIWIIGDIFASPPRAIPDLEAALAGISLHDAPAAAQRFLSAHSADILGGTPADLVAIIQAAADTKTS